MDKFELVSEFKPQGDQPQAIQTLVDGIKKGEKCQTLLGVQVQGKTFTMANCHCTSEQTYYCACS